MPLCVVVATLTSVLIWRSRASVDASPTVLPSPALPLRLMRPVTNSRLSSSVVLPVPFGPTNATLRTEVPAAIGFSLTGWTWPSRDGVHLAGAPWTTFAGPMLGQAAGPRQLENHRTVTTRPPRWSHRRLFLPSCSPRGTTIATCRASAAGPARLLHARALFSEFSVHGALFSYILSSSARCSRESVSFDPFPLLALPPRNSMSPAHRRRSGGKIFPPGDKRRGRYRSKSKIGPKHWLVRRQTLRICHRCRSIVCRSRRTSPPDRVVSHSCRTSHGEARHRPGARECPWGRVSRLGGCSGRGVAFPAGSWRRAGRSASVSAGGQGAVTGISFARPEIDGARGTGKWKPTRRRSLNVCQDSSV